jgi:hypothetical protein
MITTNNISCQLAPKKKKKESTQLRTQKLEMIATH